MAGATAAAFLLGSPSARSASSGRAQEYQLPLKLYAPSRQRRARRGRPVSGVRLVKESTGPAN